MHRLTLLSLVIGRLACIGISNGGFEMPSVADEQELDSIEGWEGSFSILPSSS